MSFCPSAEPTKPRLCALSQPHLEGKAARSVKGPAAARFAARHVGALPSVRVGHFCGRFPSVPVDAASSASQQQAPTGTAARVCLGSAGGKETQHCPQRCSRRRFPSRVPSDTSSQRGPPAELWHRWFLQLHASGGFIFGIPSSMGCAVIPCSSILAGQGKAL